MSQNKWFNPQLPQMLQGAVLFSYLNAFFALIGLLSGASGIEFIILLGGLGAWGIANERRWGYYLCLVVGIVYLVVQLLFFFLYPFAFSPMLNLLFSIFLVGLLLHPISRSYQRIYFR